MKTNIRWQYSSRPKNGNAKIVIRIKMNTRLLAVVLVHSVVYDAADAEGLEILESFPVIPLICPAEQNLALCR